MLHESKFEEKPEYGKSRVKAHNFRKQRKTQSVYFLSLKLIKSGASNTIIIVKVEALTLVGLD